MYDKYTEDHDLYIFSTESQKYSTKIKSIQRVTTNASQIEPGVIIFGGQVKGYDDGFFTFDGKDRSLKKIM